MESGAHVLLPEYCTVRHLNEHLIVLVRLLAEQEGDMLDRHAPLLAFEAAFGAEGSLDDRCPLKTWMAERDGG